jgi:formylglycine-generating enzyme required for sulfatase activity
MVPRKSLPLILFALLLPLAALSAQQKHALVIGNGAYTGITPLNNPVNDANDISAALRGLGFTVDLVTNAGRVQMEEAVTRLKNRLNAVRGSYGFLYYAGHGVQSAGENYLIPVDANIPGEAYLRDRSVSMQAVLDELNAAGNTLNIVVLDACRDNPFGWRRGGSRGLQVVSNLPADSIIVYATSAGSAAADGIGRNGLFTTHLLNNLKKPGLSVRDVFDQTGADVRRASGGSQIPAIYSQFFDVAYLGTRPSVNPAPSPTPSPQPRPAPVVVPPEPAPQPVPDGFVRISGGTFAMGSPSSEADRDSDEVQRRVTVSGFYMGRYEVTQREWAEVMGSNPSEFKGDNLPIEKVSWHDVIDYCNRRSQREGLTPVYTRSGDTVTWNRGANGYRLPTEAEWEYACRAGTSGPFSTGSNITTNQANYDGTYAKVKGAYRQQTWNVGSGAANAWGLYDMHGNVSEWCWDWYGGYASGAQADPAGAASGSARVVRGGCWGCYVYNLRSAARFSLTPSYRGRNFGFRLVRNVQ